MTDLTTPPTQAEINKVKRWECYTGNGHDFITITAYKTIEPVRILCSHCNRSWSVEEDTGPIYSE